MKRAIKKLFKRFGFDYDAWYNNKYCSPVSTESECRNRHIAYGYDEKNWICKICDRIYRKRLSDCDTGPR